MKEQIKTPEIIQVSNEEIANLKDAQFKTLVIRRLTELVECGRKIDEKMKAMLSEIKENVQGTNSDVKEIRTQRFGAEGRNKHSSGQNEKTRIQKYEESLRNLQDNFKHSI